MEKKDEKYNIELVKKINALSKSLGFTQDEQTLLEIKKTDDKNIKELHLKWKLGIKRSMVCNR